FKLIDAFNLSEALLLKIRPDIQSLWYQLKLKINSNGQLLSKAEIKKELNTLFRNNNKGRFEANQAIGDLLDFYRNSAQRDNYLVGQLKNIDGRILIVRGEEHQPFIKKEMEEASKNGHKIEAVEVNVSNGDIAHDMAVGASQDVPERDRMQPGETAKQYQKRLEEKYGVEIQIIKTREGLKNAARQVGLTLNDTDRGFGYYSRNKGKAIVYVLDGFQTDSTLMIHEISEALSRQPEGIAPAGQETGGKAQVGKNAPGQVRGSGSNIIVGAMHKKDGQLFKEMQRRFGRIIDRFGWNRVMDALEQKRQENQQEHDSFIRVALEQLQEAGIPVAQAQRMLGRILLVDVKDKKLQRVSDELGGLVVGHNGILKILFPEERMRNIAQEGIAGNEKVLGHLLHELIEVELLEAGLTVEQAHALALQVNQAWDNGRAQAAAEEIAKLRAACQIRSIALNGLLGAQRAAEKGVIVDRDSGMGAEAVIRQLRSSKDFFRAEVGRHGEGYIRWQIEKILPAAARGLFKLLWDNKLARSIINEMFLTSCVLFRKDQYNKYILQVAQELLGRDWERSPVGIMAERNGDTLYHLSSLIEKNGRDVVEERLKNGAVILMTTSKNLEELEKGIASNDLFDPWSGGVLGFPEIEPNLIAAIFVPEHLFDIVKTTLPRKLRNKIVKVRGEIRANSVKDEFGQIFWIESKEVNLKIPDWFGALYNFMLRNRGNLKPTLMVHGTRLPTVADIVSGAKAQALITPQAEFSDGIIGAMHQTKLDSTSGNSVSSVDAGKNAPGRKRAKPQGQNLVTSAAAKIIEEISAESNVLKSYWLKLKLLESLGVISKDRVVLYPLIGADLMPAGFAPVIGMDMELPENMGSKVNLRKFIDELAEEGYVPEDFKRQIAGGFGQAGSAVNIPMDLLRASNDDWQSLRKRTDKSQVGALFIKGWGNFVMLKDMGRMTNKEYRSKLWEFIRKIDNEFMPEGSFVILFNHSAEEIEKIKNELGYVDYLEETLSRDLFLKLNRADSSLEARINAGTIGSRKFLIGGKMVVLQKKETVRAESGLEEALNLELNQWLKNGFGKTTVEASDGNKFTFNYFIGEDPFESDGYVRTGHVIEVSHRGKRIGYVHFFIDENREKGTYAVMWAAFFEHSKVGGLQQGEAIFVDPSYSRYYRGIGASLLGMALRFARMKGAKQFGVVEVYAPEFFRKAGFELTASEETGHFRNLQNHGITKLPKIQILLAETGAGSVKEGAQDHASEGDVTLEGARKLADLADALGVNSERLPPDIVRELEKVLGPGKAQGLVVRIMKDDLMLNQDNKPIQGLVRLGNQIFIGEDYLRRNNNDWLQVLTKLGHEGMSKWIAEDHPDIGEKEAHELAKQLEEVIRLNRKAEGKNEAGQEAQLIETMKQVRASAGGELCLGVSIALAKALRQQGIDAVVYAAHDARGSFYDEHGNAVVHYWVETPGYLLDAFPEGLGKHKAMVKSHIKEGFVIINKRLPLPYIYAFGRTASKQELGSDYFELSVGIHNSEVKENAGKNEAGQEGIRYLNTNEVGIPAEVIAQRVEELWQIGSKGGY
ncbi:MAG: GNAT family N-acetyltransferase, partial [Candidatus Omnitrophica bacterium]|nr:GNAT family N-acetyltransferase [Candidatus Omnitrophota bacterium]